MKKIYKISHLRTHGNYTPTSFQHSICKPGKNEAIRSYKAVTNTWQTHSITPSSSSQADITGTNGQSLQQESAAYIKPKQLAIILQKVRAEHNQWFWVIHNTEVFPLDRKSVV